MSYTSDAVRALGRCAIPAMVLLLAVTASPVAIRPASAAGTATAVLAGGCFWGMEDVFERLNGVSDVVVGYSGGDAATAHYETVSGGSTGHAESIKITYDPARISYRTLLEVYFRVAHDPTQRDRQGPDDGSQYRSVVFYASAAQRREVEAEIASLTQAKAFAAPIVTEVVPLRAFYPAESYHQHFADKNPAYPYIVAIDIPKVDALRSKFPKLLKSA